MFAKTLENVLLRLMQGADIAGADAQDMAARFDSLRGSALLPRGRENRSARLRSDEIANAVLGLAAHRPSWAATACNGLRRLQPLDGAAPARFREPSVRALLARLVTDEAARDAFVRIRLSMSESGVNFHGAVTAYFRLDGEVRPSTYVSDFAGSALAAGQAAYDVDRRHAPVSRDIVLSQPFFVELARAIAWSERLPAPDGDGSEYDADDAHRARMERLRIGPGAHVLNMAVETQAAWPRTETMITFDGVRLILMPPSRDTTTSIHVDLHGNRITSEAAQTLIRRFLSVLAWEDDQFAVLGYGWSGNPVPVAVPKSNLAFATAEPWLSPRRSAGEPRADRALAHYRAGVNADHAGLVSYAVLSFYKVLEIRFAKYDVLQKWIARVLPDVRAGHHDPELWTRFDLSRGEELPEAYIRKAYRTAAAHAATGQPSDEDESDELLRLATGADVLRALARKLMIEELRIDERLAAPPGVGILDDGAADVTGDGD
ncbi:MAG: hypothetical protein JHD15_22425 [Phenylobacterium sp.]|uniref:methylamine utilization protein MauJ n=1 Tax=Phenylobacterium sp. TaxID=1871053 RepID=UPI001A228D6E|nr:methylamine utilization protein MauJ [Phenylobacterium sp.]MBJ7413093.1 hypothetical protein [Phenylobacterium sp.]